ncbi:hypothetical protein [Gluconobacter morbifer]|uniref:HTH cro/C1-type domain-containing protein n=1 Tax=Gluconobacter morbifer G707 TaxID=1088869 RepID=G6XIX2_9PROT|nr:hypothetical protein [Gluconobacter morbifer]EHH68402.1 hypothetical protein GMO_11720 [Gluconobacter morbifer G707]
MAESRAKDGNFFPFSLPGQIESCADLVARVLRGRFGNGRHAAKRIAQMGEVSPRTARNWMSGSCAPRGDELMRMMVECDELADEIFRKVREQRCLTEKE